MAYNLTPVAGVATRISRDGQLVETCPASCIMSPLPLSGSINLPVTILGFFLVRHNQGRYLFKSQETRTSDRTQPDAGSQLIEAWNRELLSCVRDSYVKLVLEMQKLRREHSSSILEPRLGHAVRGTLNALGDQLYSFWPRSKGNTLLSKPENNESNLVSPKVPMADWDCLVEQVIRPFYTQLIDRPMWQLYSGNLVKAEEGMFLSQPGIGVGGSSVPASVCDFIKEHYPVFSVPWELVTEIQAVGFTVREIKPRMVRNLLRDSSTLFPLSSVDTYIDVMDYCLSDIQLMDSAESSRNPLIDTSCSDFPTITPGNGSSVSLSSSNVQSSSRTSAPGSSGGDALELMTNLGKALFHLGRGVVEDISRPGPSEKHWTTGSKNFRVPENVDQKLLSVAGELRGLPCPTATNNLIRLGLKEVWIGSKEQQILMNSLAAKFIHPNVLDRFRLFNIFSNASLHSLLNLKSFSFQLLANNMRFLFHESWVNHVMESNTVPWFSWENTASPSMEWWPSPEWIKLFWRNFSGSLDDLSLFSDWPLIPAFLGRPVLCRLKERNIVFIPPLISDSHSMSGIDETNIALSSDMSGLSDEPGTTPYTLSFKIVEKTYPWLFSFLNQCNIPVFDATFLDCISTCNCLPTSDQSLAKVIVSKLVAAKQAGYLPELTSFSPSECDELLDIFASDFCSNGSEFEREELEILRDLPIYRTAAGTYTKLQNQDTCMIASCTFLKSDDERCLFYTTESNKSPLLRALGVPELHDKEILVKFGLPGFEGKPEAEQEDVLIFLYMNWQDLQQDSSVIVALKETNFVKTADEHSGRLYKPVDLYDPGDTLLNSVFSGVRDKFPGERFISDGWLQILRKVGLRTSIEPDIMLECAKRVEFLGSEYMRPAAVLDNLETDILRSQNEISFEIWLLAESLLKAIFSNFAVLYSNNFCNILGKIACVPAENGFPGACGTQAGRKVLCSYNEAIILKDWPLAWSCAPILSRQGVPPEYSWGPLHLRSPPPFATVLKHLQV